MQDKGKLPPQAVELEEAVIGALLLQSNSVEVENLLPDIKPDYFYKSNHQIVVECILSLKNRNEPVDIMTVTIELKKIGKLEVVGGAYAITQLTNRVASSMNIEHHFTIIKQHYLKRKIIADSSNLITDSYDETIDVFDIIDKAELTVNELMANIMTSKIIDSLELFNESLKRNNLLLNNEGVLGVTSGFNDIDKLTGGWQPSDLIILAARPAMGKTSLALEFLKNPALNGIPTAFFSLEMSNQQLYSRLQAQESGYELSDITRNGIQKGNLQDFKDKCKHLSNAPIYFDDTGGITLFELRNKARKLKRDKGIKLLVIDYLQLMTSKTKGFSKENEVSEISKGLKSLAKELNIPIICLSQLSRAVESRGGEKIPMLSDLRDSGSIEQDADIVSFIYRPEYYGITEDSEGNSTKGKAFIMFAKHRNGRTENIPLNFIAEQVKFTNNNDYIKPNYDFDNEPLF